MKNDTNSVILEGKLLYPITVEKKDGKTAFNFVIGVTRFTSKGKKVFHFSCVSWDEEKEEFLMSIPIYSKLKIIGHLQENKIEKGDGKYFSYSKVCADIIELKQ